MINKDTCLWTLTWLVMLSGFLSMVTACPPAAATCTHLQTQCAANAAQVCDTHGQWETITDCAAVEGDSPFTCQVDPEDAEAIPACLPEGTP
jgi:hypothetical protein